MAEGECLCKLIVAIVGIGILLTVILVPMSFAGLDYFEYGFKKQKSTGSVDTGEVYAFGKYMVGPDYEFKVFPADAQHVSLTLNIFTEDKLEITLTAYFQYFLRKDDLPYLHKFYDLMYEPTIKSSAIAALKIESPRHSTDDYIKNRKKVEEALFAVVRRRLGGSCCASNCNSWKFACEAGCTPLQNCDHEREKGLWVDVKYFQLGAISIPSDVSERFLKKLTLAEEGARENFVQDAAVVRKITTSKVQEILNRAKEFRQKAEAESQLIATLSRANYTSTVEKARSQGLRNLYTRLNINDQGIKNSFDYLRTLRGLDHVHLTVDFQQRIVGGLN